MSVVNPQQAPREASTAGMTQEDIRERTPEDIPIIVDDDIVARQLREVALAEEDPELRERLWPYIGGIAKQNRMKSLAIGGVEDHSSPFWRNTTSNMIRVISGTSDASRQSSLTGLTFRNRNLVTQR